MRRGSRGSRFRALAKSLVKAGRAFVVRGLEHERRSVDWMLRGVVNAFIAKVVRWRRVDCAAELLTN